MWWTGVVEAAGNAAVVAVLGWRIKATVRAKFWALVAFQIAALAWFTSNVAYAVYYVMWEAFEIDWWSGVHYDVTKGLQQLAIMALPVTVLYLIGQLFRDYRTAARRLAGQ